MNQFSEVEHMRSTIEELSVKKQLPRRQQTDKPVLRYDKHDTKPVQVFHENDRLDCHDSHRRQGSAPGTPTNYMALKGSIHSRSPSSQRRVRNGSSGSSHSSSSARAIKNPYSRPLSAKEVIEDMQQNYRYRQFQPQQAGGHPAVSVVSSYNTSMLRNSTEDGLNMGSSSLSQNSFLRSQNDMHHTFVPNKSSPQKKEQRTVSSLGAGDQPEFLSQSVDGQRMKSRGHLPFQQSAKKSFHQPFAHSLTTCATNSMGHPVRIGFPSGSKNSQIRDRQRDVPSGPPTTVLRNRNCQNKSYTGIYNSVANRTVSEHSTSILMSSSENVNFSNKQPVTNISEVKSVNGLKTTHSSLENCKVPSVRVGTNSQTEPCQNSEDIGSMAGVEESGLPLHNLTASSLLNTRMGMLRKMPAPSILSGTDYYKKSFRQASKHLQQRQHPFLLEHRPRGDGAPSKQACISAEEKAVVTFHTEDFEEEDVDDVSTPSGERLPGDGEASVEDFDDDDGIDDLYNDSQDEDAGDSDEYSITSTMSQGSASAIRLRSASSRPSTIQSARSRTTAVGEERVRSVARPLTSGGETVVQPALRHSIFPAVPPTINFISEGEKVEQLPWEIRKLLKWRMSPITPNVVKAVLARSNFRITKKNSDWLGCFGKHMKASGFKCIREYQKLNHFPGSFQLGRKDRLWRNLLRMQVSFGKKEFGFFPQTYVLPQDLKQLKRSWEDASARQKWIIKPPASARGIGIKVINKWNQIPRKRPVIVQKYLGKPFLINDSKFDMRIYVYVTSYDPLRAYIFEDGLARFASCKYSSSVKNLNNKFMHLTNYSINKRNAEYQSNTDDTVCQGHKWSLKSLWNYLKSEGVNTQAVWDSIKDIVIKTLISADGSINTMIKSNVRSRYIVHELFGFDILLDEQFRPWILEVNISPSLHSSSQLDINIKGQMVRDMMNLAGFRVPDKNDITNSVLGSSSAPDLSAHIPSTDYCMDKRLFTNQLAGDERAKHAYFCHKHQDEQVLQGILDTLTPDDVRILTESIDEDSRKGGFIRVFPTPSTKKYLRYFEQPRYYNLLLDQWVTRYNRMEPRGISMLQGLCEDGIHLENPTSNIHHQWCPPNSAAAMLSARDKNPSPSKKDVQLGQIKSCPSMPRLPRMQNGSGDSQPPTSVTLFTGTSSLTNMNSSPVSRAAKPLDPTR